MFPSSSSPLLQKLGGLLQSSLTPSVSPYPSLPQPCNPQAPFIILNLTCFYYLFSDSYKPLEGHVASNVPCLCLLIHPSIYPSIHSKSYWIHRVSGWRRPLWGGDIWAAGSTEGVSMERAGVVRREDIRAKALRQMCLKELRRQRISAGCQETWLEWLSRLNHIRAAVTDRFKQRGRSF